MNIENWNFEEYEKEKKEFEKLKQIERLQREKEANMDTYFVELKYVAPLEIDNEVIK